MYNIIHIFISLSICTTLLVPEVEAFTPCSRPALYYPQTEKVVTSTRSRLYAVADPPSPPADYQGEDEKQRASDGDADDWTPTEGGFFPKFLTRKKTKINTIEIVDNIEDYKKVVVDEKDKMVVVRFHAAWCRSCKASEPYFKRLVSKHTSGVKFVQVPLSKETAYLQEGLGKFSQFHDLGAEYHVCFKSLYNIANLFLSLFEIAGVPSVPFAHIYHPEAGLVEEMKVSKPHFKTFQDSLGSYVAGSCELPDDDPFDVNISQGDFQ